MNENQELVNWKRPRIPKPIPQLPVVVEVPDVREVQADVEPPPADAAVVAPPPAEAADENAIETA